MHRPMLSAHMKSGLRSENLQS